jgi:hypothetical protein
MAESNRPVIAAVPPARWVNLNLTADQAAHLRDLGCQFAQDYLFAPPLDARAAEDMICAHVTRVAGAPRVA